MTVRININIADIRAEQSHSSRRVSQGLFNEPVDIVGEGESMSKVRFQNGYEGWIGSQFLSSGAISEGEVPFIVQSGLATAFEKPDPSSRKLTYIPYGSCLQGNRKLGFLEVSSKRYGGFYIQEADLIGQDSIAPPGGSKSNDIISEAEKFLGVPYLWGGRSFFGLDCSGFVGLIAARFGVLLPRDSKEQIKEGSAIGKEEARHGDLLFFPGHVALAVSKVLFIHASRGNGGVAYNSFEPDSPIYHRTLDESLLAVRRIFP